MTNAEKHASRIAPMFTLGSLGHNFILKPHDNAHTNRRPAQTWSLGGILSIDPNKQEDRMAEKKVTNGASVQADLEPQESQATGCYLRRCR